jgi:hypothetical protein
MCLPPAKSERFKYRNRAECGDVPVDFRKVLANTGLNEKDSPGDTAQLRVSSVASRARDELGHSSDLEAVGSEGR